jgi:hypothetical protein
MYLMRELVITEEDEMMFARMDKSVQIELGILIYFLNILMKILYIFYLRNTYRGLLWLLQTNS